MQGWIIPNRLAILSHRSKVTSNMALLMRGMLRQFDSFLFMTVSEKLRVESRRCVRALRRTPVKVLYPETDAAGKLQAVQSIKAPEVSAENKSSPISRGAERQSEYETKKRSHGPSVTTSHRVYEIQGETPGLRYEKANPLDKKLGKVITIAKSRKFRDQHGKILLEGRRLIIDALSSGAVLNTLFFSTVDQLKEFPQEKLKRANLIKVKFEDIQTWSDLVTPQGFMAIFSKPDHSKMTYPSMELKHALPMSLICDNIRDPGNLGTILRSAAGAGCSKVLLTKGCVDVWEPKVLRAAMGAHFRIPVISNLAWEEIPNYLPSTIAVHVADSCSRPPESRPQPRKATLNKQKMHYEEDEDEDSDSDSDMGRFTLPDVESQLYHKNWASGEFAVVIGGETHGLSLEALQLSETTRGRRLIIPMVPGMDSLNSAVAASILIFEGKRQHNLKAKQEQLKSHCQLP
ncbi:rRNA methyltransferase 3A, mitochondrial [Erpetoichthys calabaricus]|uniref:Mitochondrial rRNA methyltransferase 3a n=1 Tax=Erpetoichthys calabaricus TaxID=27687 RepID=A0A8C4S2K0_ERPCA|nr:rRNA methyltransferase 3A, mitochondrial [Erpetoichthys calabaricus]